MMRSWTRHNGSNPLGSLSLHPRCGKIRADVNRQIIQNSPYGRGRSAFEIPVWFRLGRLRISWFVPSSTRPSSPSLSLSSVIVTFSDRSAPLILRFISTTSSSDTPSSKAIHSIASGERSLFETFQLTLHRAQVEEELLLQRVLPEVPGALAVRRRSRAVGSDLAEDLLNQPAILHQNLINIHSHDSRPG